MTYFFDIALFVIKIDNGRIKLVDKNATGNITKNDLIQFTKRLEVPIFKIVPVNDIMLVIKKETKNDWITFRYFSLICLIIY